VFKNIGVVGCRVDSIDTSSFVELELPGGGDTHRVELAVSFSQTNWRSGVLLAATCTSFVDKSVPLATSCLLSSVSGS
jgi:hypothetical protein